MNTLFYKNNLKFFPQTLHKSKQQHKYPTTKKAFHTMPTQIEKFLDSQGRLNRFPFLLNVVATLMVAFLLSLLAHKSLSPIENFDTMALFLILIVASVAAIIVFIQIIKRLHDLGRDGINGLLLLVPVYNIYLLLILLFKKGRG